MLKEIENRLISYSAVLRNHCLLMALKTGKTGSHLGGALSLIEVFATLFGEILNMNSVDPDDPQRDRLIISKGHCVLAYYSALYSKGFLNKELIDSFETNGAFLHGHATRDVNKGIEFSGGSLGLGISYAVGVALRAKIDKINYHTYVIVGDGECNEGIVWEAIMSASHYKLDNLTIIVDDNKLQYDGAPKDVMNMEDLELKFRSFGCFTLRVDGHSVNELYKAFIHNVSNKPKVIIADTIKGKGVSFMEGQKEWHHAVLSMENYQKAMSEQKDQTLL